MTSHPDLDSTYSWFRLILTLLVAVVANAGMWMVIAVLPDMERDFGVSRAAASMPYVLTMIGFALGNFLVGRLIDQFGVTRCLQGTALAIAAAFYAATQASGVVSLSVAHLFLGLATSVGFAPLMADLSHWFFRHRGVAVSLVASGNYLSGAVWPLVLSDLLAQGDWRAVYQAMSVITVVAMIPLSLSLRRRIAAEAQAVAAVAASARAATVGLSPRTLAIILGFAGVACCVAMSMPQVHIVAYCVGLGYGPTAGQHMLVLMLLGGVVSRVISGLLADRLGGVRTLLIGSVLQCIALMLYLPWDGMASLYVVSTIFGLSQGGIVPSYAVIVREYMPPRDAGALVGFVMMLTILGMALGGWMSGWIFDFTGSYQAAFLNGIVWNGANIAIVTWLLMWSRPRSLTSQPA